MPGSPSRGDVHVNSPLTNISEAFLQSSEAFVHNQGIFPLVNVEKRSDVFFKYNKEDFNRDEFQLRADGAESALANFGLSTDSYLCDVWSLGVDLGDQTLANADSPLNLESDTTKFLMNKMLISMEKQWTNSFFKTGIWTGSSTGSDITTLTWGAAGADPIADIQNQADAMHLATGFYPNTICLGATAYRTLINHSAVVDRIKYTQTGTVTEDLIAGLLGIPRVFVLRGVEETKKEGQSGSTMASIGTTDDVALFYAAPSPSLMTPSAGYGFNWGRYLSGSAGQRVLRYDLPQRQATRIQVEAASDYKPVPAQLGCYMVDADASS
mgnify:CR=1 FL=1